MPYSEVVKTTFNLQLFCGSSLVSSYTLNGSLLDSNPLIPFVTFGMQNSFSDKTSASLFFEIVQSEMLSSSENSCQQLYKTVVRSTNSDYSEQVIPISVLESSFLLPHKPLHLALSNSGFSILDNSIEILFIPFATIENIKCGEYTLLGHGVVSASCEFLINRPHHGYSDLILLSIIARKDSSIWKLLSKTPQISPHREYRYV